MFREQLIGIYVHLFTLKTMILFLVYMNCSSLSSRNFLTYLPFLHNLDNIFPFNLFIIKKSNKLRINYGTLLSVCKTAGSFFNRLWWTSLSLWTGNAISATSLAYKAQKYYIRKRQRCISMITLLQYPTMTYFTKIWVSIPDFCNISSACWKTYEHI